MLIVALTTFLGIKLPMPHLPGSAPNKTDVLSIFTLGIFSGITSACCAPVLIGILTLTFLSPNFLGAVAIGGMYVLGMITPLLLISVFLSGKMPASNFLRQRVLTINLLGRSYFVIVSNLIASLVFVITGILILTLTLNGQLAMTNVQGFTQTIQNSAWFINGLVGNNLAVNALFVLLVLFGLYLISKRV